MPELSGHLREQVDWPRRQEADPRDPRWLGQGPCGFNHEPERRWSSNKFAIWSKCAKCALRLEAVPLKGSPGAHHKGPLAQTVIAALEKARQREMWNTLDGNQMRGLIKEVEGQNQAARRSTRTYVNMRAEPGAATTAAPTPATSQAASRASSPGSWAAPSTAPSARSVRTARSAPRPTSSAASAVSERPAGRLPTFGTAVPQSPSASSTSWQDIGDVGDADSVLQFREVIYLRWRVITARMLRRHVRDLDATAMEG